MKFASLPTLKWSRELAQKDKCLIDGEEQPYWLGKVIKMMSEGTQPRILVLGDPGHGKTQAVGALCEILHEELGVLDGKFEPEKQITMDPVYFSEAVRSNRGKIYAVPDADAIYPSNEHHTEKNKNNRKLLYQSRVFSNILVYDAHEMSGCDKGIRTNHNIRLVSKGNGNNYEFMCYRIKRENDSQKEEIEKKPLGLWKFDLPSEETQERIKQLDEKEKEENLIQSEDKMKLKRKKREMMSKAFN